MMKKLVVLLACLGLTFQVVSCTSKDSQSDSESTSDFDSADLETLDGEAVAGDGEAVEGGDELAAGDDLPEDALGESESDLASNEAGLESEDALPADTLAEAEVEDAQQLSGTEPDLAPELSPELTPDPLAETSSDVTYSDTSAAPTETADSGSAFESTPSYETSSEASTTYVDSGSKSSSYDSEPAQVANVPLQKIPSAPWKQGVWFNTVYFARPGDTLSSISTNIYGSNKVSQLKKGNPTFNSRGVKPGDKVYYNSPNRPDDSTKLITYHEDMGMSPEVYVASPGENIRDISKKLLGYSNAWKEVWASNPVESKGVLSEGAELRYWKAGIASNASAPAEVAQATPAAPVEDVANAEVPPMTPPEGMNAEGDAQAMADIPPAPDMGMDPSMNTAQNDLPPPPPMEMGGVDDMPPPPPPPMDAPATTSTAPDMEAEGEDPDQQMMLIGGIGGLAALLGIMMVRNKRKRRDLEMQSMDNTHVGS